MTSQSSIYKAGVDTDFKQELIITNLKASGRVRYPCTFFPSLHH